MRVMTTLLMVMFLIGMDTVTGYTSERVILLPKGLEEIHLGMTYSELKKQFPKSHDAVGKPEEEVIIFDDIHNEALWDAVEYDFVKGKMVSFSLLKGAVKSMGVREAVPVILKEALKEYGKDFDKKISLDPSKKMHPVYIWDKGEFKVYLSYSPVKLIEQVKQPSIRLTFATPDRKLAELFELPTQADLEEALFNILTREEFGRIN